MQKYDIFPWHAISCFWISPGFILFLYSVLPFLVFLPISLPVFSLFPSWRRGFRCWWCLSFAARRQRFLFPSDCFPPRNWPFLPLKAVTFALLCGQSVGNSAAENLPKHYRKRKKWGDKGDSEAKKWRKGWHYDFHTSLLLAPDNLSQSLLVGSIN